MLEVVTDIRIEMFHHIIKVIVLRIDLLGPFPLTGGVDPNYVGKMTPIV